MSISPKGSKRLKIVCLTLCGLAMVAFLSIRSTEPSYQGWTLSECLEAHNVTLPGYTEKRDKEAEHALRQMGAQAVPHLVKMLQARDTVWLRFQTKLHEDFGWLNLKAPPELGELHWRGMVGLAILGKQAKSAIPPLLVLCHDPDEDLRSKAIGLLDDIGLEDSEMIPVLRDALTDSSDRVISEALNGLMKRSTAAKSAVPGLLALLSHSDYSVRRESMTVLLTISASNTTALIPLLKQQFEDRHAMVRGNAMVLFAQQEKDTELKHKALARFLADPDASVRFKATNLLSGGNNQRPESPAEFRFSEITVGDLLDVWSRNMGGKFQLAAGLNTNSVIYMDTFGPLSNEEQFRLLETVLKEQVGFEFHSLTNGETLVIQGKLPPP